MSQKNEEIFRRWVEEVWVRGNEGTIDEFFDDQSAADYTNNLSSKPIQGREDYKKFVRFIRELFIDIQIIIEQIAADEGKVISFCTFKANRRIVSEKGQSGLVPIEVSGLCQVIIINGKIARSWSNLNPCGAS